MNVPSSITPIKVMCSSRLDPTLVLTALLRGADGVLVAGCHPGDCHYGKGNYYARRRLYLLKEVLAALGLEEDRLSLEWISASEGKRFADVASDFDRRIRELGPNPIRKRGQT